MPEELKPDDPIEPILEPASSAPEPPATRELPKPWVARQLNRWGIGTTPTIDWVLDWVQIGVIATALALITMNFVIVRMRVPTGTM
ncbi:MAG: hypothetical protein N3E42_05005 [Candidatus Bipolaricaulota bacterium]|nr:hypothetical protein [Candidatus Bipolaricaulota bacterium]